MANIAVFAYCLWQRRWEFNILPHVLFPLISADATHQSAGPASRPMAEAVSMQDIQVGVRERAALRVIDQPYGATAMLS